MKNNTEWPSSAAQDQHHQDVEVPRCPRCDSTNTKFCYYNNYSRLQPRHFCKACKRYWTRGGTLRNVPVGGGCRKNNKRTAKAWASTALVAPTRAIPSSSIQSCSSHLQPSISYSSSFESLALMQGLPNSNYRSSCAGIFDDLPPAQLGFPPAQFDVVEFCHRPHDQGLFPCEEFRGRGVDVDLSMVKQEEREENANDNHCNYFNNSSIEDWQILCHDSFREAGTVAAPTVVQNDLIWSQPEVAAECQILPIADRTPHLYSTSL